MSHPPHKLFATLTILGAITVFGLAAAPGVARAQEPVYADSMAMMQEMMGPMMSTMMVSMMEGMLAVLAKPESAERLATFTRNYYDALLRKGFNEEQALRLTAAVGFPSLAPGN
jgi:hypothetical protein